MNWLMRSCRAGLVLLAAALLQGCFVNMSLFPNYNNLVEVEVREADSFFTTDKILMIDCAGVISGEGARGPLRRPSMLLYVTDCLREAEEDGNIKAVFLRINSPGGGVTASDLIHHELVRFQERRAELGKPVKIVAGMMDLAASGGYYIAMGADKVYALPTTVTGSIGVVTMFFDLTGLSGKIGLGMRVIKSGEMKDSGSPFREMTVAEQQVWQELIDSMYGRFVDIVAANRTALSRAEIMKLADGRVYTAGQAHDLGLIDGVMYLDQMLDATEELAELDDSRVVMFRFQPRPSGNIYAGRQLPAPQASEGSELNLINVDLGRLLESGGPYLQYRYLP
ncbi:signal peptide peptidase SppA [Candidatus Sumerlaeota bacterium]